MLIVRLADRLIKALMILAAFWAFILCFFILAEIISRAMNMPLQGTKEIVANSVVMIIFLQLGFAIRSGSMLHADFVVNAIGPTGQRIIVTLGYIAGAVFFAILFMGGIEPAMRSWTNGEFDGEGALRVPVWPARFTILIGSAIAVFSYVLLAIVEAFGLEVEEMVL